MPFCSLCTLLGSSGKSESSLEIWTCLQYARSSQRDGPASRGGLQEARAGSRSYLARDAKSCNYEGTGQPEFLIYQFWFILIMEGETDELSRINCSSFKDKWFSFPFFIYYFTFSFAPEECFFAKMLFLCYCCSLSSSSNLSWSSCLL